MSTFKAKRFAIPVKFPDPVGLGFLLLGGVVAQTVVSARLGILGVSPDLFLLLVVAVAVSRGSLTGAVFGFCAGFLADIIFLDPIGLHTFVSLVAGYAVGRYSEQVGLGSAWMLILVTGVVALGSQSVYGMLQFVLGYPGSFFAMFGAQMLPAALLNGLLAAPVYLSLVRLGMLPPLEGANPSFR